MELFKREIGEGKKNQLSRFAIYDRTRSKLVLVGESYGFSSRHLTGVIWGVALGEHSRQLKGFKLLDLVDEILQSIADDDDDKHKERQLDYFPNPEVTLKMAKNSPFLNIGHWTWRKGRHFPSKEDGCIGSPGSNAIQQFGSVREDTFWKRNRIIVFIEPSRSVHQVDDSLIYARVIVKHMRDKTGKRLDLIKSRDCLIFIGSEEDARGDVGRHCCSDKPRFNSGDLEEWSWNMCFRDNSKLFIVHRDSGRYVSTKQGGFVRLQKKETVVTIIFRMLKYCCLKGRGFHSASSYARVVREHMHGDLLMRRSVSKAIKLLVLVVGDRDLYSDYDKQLQRRS